MAEFRPGTPDQDAFLQDLIAHGHLVETGVPGVYGRGADFEAVRTGVNQRITRAVAGEHAEALRFPPVMPRRTMERNGYLKSFPHLAGAVFGFEGTEAQARAQAELAANGQDWSAQQRMSDLVLTPAVCHPVYPAVARRGPVPREGLTIDPGDGYAFRMEPSGDPARLQTFHMRELVRIADPDTVQAWRERWRDQALDLLRGLGLEADFAVANDPFFGRGGRIMAASQREQALKFEILVPIAADAEPTAVCSFNYHQDHFAAIHGLQLEGGGTVHSACLGFGLERVALALLKAHGLDVAAWPAAVRAELWDRA